jgi:methionine synthase II (cobalamin-independent)
MKHSSERMLTTHTGSLARPLDLIQAMQLKERGQEYDTEVYSGLVRDAVADVVNRQVEAGVDIICDGEQGKPSFLAYVKDRLSGFESREAALGEDPSKGSREHHRLSRVLRMERQDSLRHRGATHGHHL